MRISSLAQAGGVNSIENFSRSWQRAAAFPEITPVRHSFIVSEQEQEQNERRPPSEERTPTQHRSLIRQQLEREGTSPENAVQDESTAAEHIDDESSDPQAAVNPKDDRESDVFAQAPYLASPFASSYGGLYGSLSSRVNESSKRDAGRLFQEQQISGVQDPDKERQPLLLKKVEREDGKIIHVVIGQSTLPQTVFNSVNVLIGVGLLSLPLGIKYAGWLIGMLFLLFAAIVTNYTAGLLAKCLNVDSSLVTFADLAYVSFGSKARIATSILFTIELVAACVALVVLFADSLDALIPGWGIVEWKIICGVVLLPLFFVPLRLLSFTSVLGIVSCIGREYIEFSLVQNNTKFQAVVIFVFIDGILKPHQPGSLREPAATYLFPQEWNTLPLSFGLLMCASSTLESEMQAATDPFYQHRGVVIASFQTSTVICGILTNIEKP